MACIHALRQQGCQLALGSLRRRTVGACAWGLANLSNTRVISTFLRNCYEGYFKKVFWKRIAGFAMNDFEVAENVLEKMAAYCTNHEDDISHWQEHWYDRDPQAYSH